MEKDLFTGVKVKRFDNGNLEEPFLNGEAHGIARYWSDKGELWTEIQYSHGKRHGFKKSITISDIWYFECRRQSIQQMEMKMQKEPLENKTLFNKKQWKKICSRA